ncbi:GNAT family N-acetyltransferase [Flavobacteriaceae bacterium KMM 6898]|nr:GNAT family N-acetyltransferase [Flavobacteriaceae bacterium KMM 6898]
MDLFEKGEIADVYEKITYLENDQSLYEATKATKNTNEKHKIYTIALVPDYLNLVLKNDKKHVQKTYSQNNLGYAIRIKNIVNLDGYLKSQFKSNSKVIKRSLTRLESCFNIRYQIIFGSITKEEYGFLMSTLREMLIRRFAQRQDDNKKIKEWDLILDKTFDQIKNKEASLFIIYDNEKPIDISLNYHFDKIMFSAISSYDIDYHKFGVGHVEMIKLVEWCLKDQYDFLELGYGDLDFKRRWCNHIYNFKYQVVYNQESLFIPIFAKMELYKLSLKEYLKGRKINMIFNIIMEKLSFKKLKELNEASDFTIKNISITESVGYEILSIVDPETEDYMYLRRILNEFLYTSQEHKDYTSIFKISENPNTFLLKGKVNAQQITFKN